MRRILLFTPLALLAACQEAQQPEATVDQDGRIDCRIAADEQFQRFCTIERTRTAQGLVLTVRKPDGGFRRLLATRDGRGVVAADGAEQAQVQIIGDNMIEVAIAGDRFRLPARIGSVGRPPA
jgi:ribosomal protein L34